MRPPAFFFLVLPWGLLPPLLLLLLLGRTRGEMVQARCRLPPRSAARADRDRAEMPAAAPPLENNAVPAAVDAPCGSRAARKPGQYAVGVGGERGDDASDAAAARQLPPRTRTRAAKTTARRPLGAGAVSRMDLQINAVEWVWRRVVVRDPCPSKRESHMVAGRLARMIAPATARRRLLARASPSIFVGYGAFERRIERQKQTHARTVPHILTPDTGRPCRHAALEGGRRGGGRGALASTLLIRPCALVPSPPCSSSSRPCCC